MGSDGSVKREELPIRLLYKLFLVARCERASAMPRCQGKFPILAPVRLIVHVSKTSYLFSSLVSTGNAET
jgi:hypothetical protein